MRPARLLAPAALVAAAIALFAVLASGGSDDGQSAAPTATATAAPQATKTPKPKTRTSGGTYTVRPGDTPSGIAEKENVAVDELLAANPDVNPDALAVGDKLKLP